MKTARSFRVRIAAFIVLLSGCLLAAACFVFLNTVEQVRLRRIDSALENLAFSQLRGFHPKDIWPHVQQSVNRSLTDEEGVEWTIRVIDKASNELVYAGPNWPEYWDDQQLPELEPMPQLRGPGQRGGEGDRRPRPDFGNESRPRDSVDDLLDEFGFGEERSGRLRGSAGGSRGPPRLMAPRFLDVGEEITGWRIGVFGNQWYTLAVGLNHTAYRGEIEELKRMIYIMLPSGLILLTLGGFWVSHSALRPIRRLTQEAQRVTAKGLDRRIPVGSADREFAELITVINDMLARLETSFTQATRFSSDAAHELKTPLTILQGELERMAQDTEAGSRQQERIFSLQDEVQRLSTILRKLLLLCQVDGGRLTLSTETINLSAWCEELAEDIQAFGPDLSIKSEIKPDVKLVADPDTLRQVMQNLVSNAVKYNEPNGWINLSLHADDKRIYFEIENAGLPIPERQRGKVFDRFYRVDAARSKVVEGSGLGLNLARELARAHGGDLELMDEGNAFRLTLLKNFGEA